jgi:hypothetical protein
MHFREEQEAARGRRFTRAGSAGGDMLEKRRKMVMRRK